MFGIGQAVGHRVIFSRLAGDKYSPGFLASALLHVPIGAAYIKAVQADSPLTRGENEVAGDCGNHSLSGLE